MAKNYNKSNYGLNKYSKGIVYKYADDTVTEIRFEDISASDPTFTEAAFKELKELSNEIYHDEAVSDHYYYNYVKATLNGEDVGNWIATTTLEDEFFEKITSLQIKKELRKILFTRLTENQRRRLLLNVLKGMTEREIAEMELVDRRAVHDSIEDARKKIKKYFKIL